MDRTQMWRYVTTALRTTSTIVRGRGCGKAVRVLMAWKHTHYSPARAVYSSMSAAEWESEERSASSESTATACVPCDWRRSRAGQEGMGEEPCWKIRC